LKSEDLKDLFLPVSPNNSTQIPDPNVRQSEEVKVEDSKTEGLSDPE
jgi:hypothetical protein